MSAYIPTANDRKNATETRRLRRRNDTTRTQSRKTKSIDSNELLFFIIIFINTARTARSPVRRQPSHRHGIHQPWTYARPRRASQKRPDLSRELFARLVLFLPSTYPARSEVHRPSAVRFDDAVRGRDFLGDGGDRCPVLPIGQHIRRAHTCCCCCCRRRPFSSSTTRAAVVLSSVAPFPRDDDSP